MKQLLLPLLIGLFCLGFCGCSDDDDDKSESTNSLYGTKWKCTTKDVMYAYLFGGGDTYAVIDFSSKTVCEVYLIQSKGIVYDHGKFDYKLDGNIVTFTEHKDGSVSTYEINGRTMTRKGSNNIAADYREFIKQ